jgi:hypothetical protein
VLAELDDEQIDALTKGLAVMAEMTRMLHEKET